MSDQKEILEIKKALETRDSLDKEIDKQNRREFADQGLKVQSVKKSIEIDTGVNEGVENVVELILKEVEPIHQIISIDGLSGTGKSTTSKFLAGKLSALTFSMGEIFRYLTYLNIFHHVNDFSSVFVNLEYRIVEGEFYLFDKERNITVEMKDKLRDKQIEAKIPQIAKETQVEAIRFTANQIESFKKQTDRKIILEGRAFTLDYLPTDLKITLTADVWVRAERRLGQDN